MDLVTPIVDAAALGAAAGAKDVVAAAVKDAYNTLKGLLARRNVNVSALERRPDSAAQRTALQETLEDLGDGSDAIDDELLAAAAATVQAVSDHDAEVAAVVGVDLADVRAAFIQIGTVNSTGDGVRARNVHTSGGLTIDTVHAGAQQGSAQQGSVPDPSPR